MKKKENHLKKEKSKTKNGLVRSKTRVVSNSDVSKQRTVFSGGLMYIDIDSSRLTGGSIKFIRASSKKKNTQGLFVAGGDKIDKAVASANEKIYIITAKPIVKKKGLAALKGLFRLK